MRTWQVDFYRRPLQDEAGHPLWELIICDANNDRSIESLTELDRAVIAQAFCPQPSVNSTWLRERLQELMHEHGVPDRIQAFRPQTVNLLEPVCESLQLTLEPTRRTSVLKQVLPAKATQYRTDPRYTNEPYEPLTLEKPAPVPLPENLWGEQWRFAAIAAQDLLPSFQNRPIPILDLPDTLSPANLNLPSTLLIPGVIIDGGRRSMPLARWLQQARPVGLNYIPGEPDGLILEAGLIDRWVLTTFADAEVRQAGLMFSDRQQSAKGLHFLLVQPDNSGMTYTGFWLLCS